jgi:hypothetical protein
MPLFVIFVFGAVVFGSGAMLAPAWPTAQPRIGLTGALALGLVMGGAVFWAMLFGWNTLVVDYLMFAIITAIFLLGTLSFAQKRAEAAGIELSDAEEGWPGLRDLLFFALVALSFILPALILPVPLDTDAQGFGYLGLMARMGGGFQSLGSWHPEISYLYAPGFSVLIAYFSQQLGQGMHSIQFGIAAILATLVVWLTFDLGSELLDKRLGRAMALVTWAGMGLFTAYMDSHFTTLLGLVFALAFLTYTARYLKHPSRLDALAAGLMLGALVLSHPDTTIILALGYVPWLLTLWFAKPRPSLRTWLVMTVVIPLIALLAIAPWLLSIRDLLGAEIVSPFSRDPGYWRVMVFYHGLWTVPAALLGAVIGLRKRDPFAILAVGWLVMVLEFSSVGLLEKLLPSLMTIIGRYDYPFSIAWHGPIIPYSILGGMALLWVWDRWSFGNRWNALFRKQASRFFAVAIAALVLIALFNRPLLEFSKGRIGFFGAFASQADVQAMEWLKHNTPTDSRVLNFPGTQTDNSHESDWVPVISERDSVYYRVQPFFHNNEASLAEQDSLRAFWLNPADPTNAELLRAARIGYVIVPQIVTNPDSIEQMFRWRAPFTEGIVMQSRLEDAAYLRKVFDADGAQVWEVLPPA